MNASVPASRSSDLPRRRGWGQFSLFTLLALVVAGAFVAAWYGEKRRRESAEQITREREVEIRRLRRMLGYQDDENFLTIIDDKKVHVRFFFGRDELHWRWQVYVPPGTAWDIDITQGEEWSDEEQSYSNSSGDGLGKTGEFTIEASITRSLNGEAYVDVHYGGERLRRPIDKWGVEVLRGTGDRTHFIAAAGGQQSFDPTGQIQLLRLHKDAPAVVPRLPAAFGISVRLEERAHQQARFQKRRRSTNE